MMTAETNRTRKKMVARDPHVLQNWTAFKDAATKRRCLIAYWEKGVMKIARLTDPYYGRHGPQVIATVKERPNGQKAIWYVSTEESDTLYRQGIDPQEVFDNYDDYRKLDMSEITWKH